MCVCATRALGVWLLLLLQDKNHHLVKNKIAKSKQQIKIDNMKFIKTELHIENTHTLEIKIGC